MKNLYTALLASALLAFSFNVNAATVTGTFDFGQIANGNEHGATSMTFTDSASTITVIATASGNDFVYLDHDSNNNAGLGVCGNATSGNNSNQCNPTSDDNVTYGETLILNFGEVVKIDSLIFRNGDHGAGFAQGAMVNITTALGGTNSFQLTNIFDISTLSSGSVFEFYNPNAGGGSSVSNNQQFYINSLTATATDRTPEVPVPAAMWLFGSGLLGLIGVARKKV